MQVRPLGLIHVIKKERKNIEGNTACERKGTRAFGSIGSKQAKNVVCSYPYDGRLMIFMKVAIH
jgi:hypothetical protein